MIFIDCNLLNFRNLGNIFLEFSEKGNVLFGKNGQGKTNFLEALYYSLAGKSFRRSVTDRQIIKYNNNFFHINVNLLKSMKDGGDKKYNIKVNYLKGKSKEIAINNKKIKKLSQLVGLNNFVLLSVEDRKIIHGYPADRRRFLDNAISQIDSLYLEYLQIYKKLLYEKKALFEKNNVDYMLLDSINEQMVEPFIYIIKKRKTFIKSIAPFVIKSYKNISDNNEDANIIYNPYVDIETPSELLYFLQKHKNKEIQEKNVIYGPHRDDFILEINGKNSKNFSSSGQIKSMILSLKIALAMFFKEYNGIVPLLFLDDIFSELDNFRIKKLIDFFDLFSQIFITVPRQDELKFFPDNFKIFEVNNGEIYAR